MARSGKSTPPSLLILAGLCASCALTGDDHSIINQSAAPVTPVLETEPVSSSDDAADDPAIWIHPRNPRRSMVIGTDKRRGLEVYDLEGIRVQILQRGRLNNVDLRQGVDWDGRTIDLAAATNRTTGTLDLFRIDRNSGRLSLLVAEGIRLGLEEPYGMCLYRDSEKKSLYAFVNDKDGRYQQWLLSSSIAGYARLEREFMLASQPEGCVSDDAGGIIYIGEEEVGVWRASADPRTEFRPLLVDHVNNGRLSPDVEGMDLYISGPETGYLIVSSQGDNSYAVYERHGDNRYLGSFRIAPNTSASVDHVSETDGLAVTAADLGPSFPEGLLVVQDGENTLPVANQNFKYLSWKMVREALGLAITEQRGVKAGER